MLRCAVTSQEDYELLNLDLDDDVEDGRDEFEKLVDELNDTFNEDHFDLDIDF